jgi:hypothetical protein
VARGQLSNPMNIMLLIVAVFPGSSPPSGVSRDARFLVGVI